MKDFVLYLVIAVLAFILLRQCSADNVSPGQVEIVKTDTVEVFVIGKNDTVEVERVKIVYLDTNPEIVSTAVDSQGDTVTTYSKTFDDSLLTATIETKVKGQLVSSKFDYLAKYPKFVLRVDTVKQTVTNEVVKPRFQIYAGAIAGGSAERFSFQPCLGLKTKKNLLFTVGFDLINKTYHLGGFTPLKF